MLQWKEAWEKIAEWWEELPGLRLECGINISPGDGIKIEVCGICGCIEILYFHDLISYDLKKEMDTKINGAVKEGNWLFPRDMQGAKQRAEWCRSVALEQ